MNLSEIGEFGLIQRFSKQFKDLQPSSSVGIGDDCAIIPLNDRERYVVTTDLLIEDIHFLKDRISPFELGYKSLAVNISDIAAMGAQPKFSFLSIAIPKEVEVEYLDNFIEGYHQLSKKHNTFLMGGDTTKSADRLAINVLVIGQIDKNAIKLRSTAKANDIICVTGNLGDSAGGLQVLLDKLPSTNLHEKLLKAHHLPEPRVKEGLFFSQFEGVHAMMDISDGIASDLKHILDASNIGAEIETTRIPVSNQLKEASKLHHWDYIKMATSGGEDYELLLTIDNNSYDDIAKEFQYEFNKPLHQIGNIKEGEKNIDWLEHGSKLTTKNLGFNHFQ